LHNAAGPLHDDALDLGVLRQAEMQALVVLGKTVDSAALLSQLGNAACVDPDCGPDPMRIRLNANQIDFEPVVFVTRITEKLVWTLVERKTPFSIGDKQVHESILVVIGGHHGVSPPSRASFRAACARQRDKGPIALIRIQDVRQVCNRMRTDQVEIQVHIVIKVRGYG
jgi:hypothetical protein